MEQERGYPINLTRHISYRFLWQIRFCWWTEYGSAIVVSICRWTLGGPVSVARSLDFRQNNVSSSLGCRPARLRLGSARLLCSCRGKLCSPGLL